MHRSDCSRARHGLRLALLVACSLAGAPAFAVDPCDGFTWQVTQERALFRGAPQSLPAGKDSAAAPQLALERLYELQLLPQTEVSFVAAPGKKMLTDGTHAGLALIDIPAAGRYRVSADSEVWIDVAAENQLVASRDFRGQRGCNAPHKVVEYDLPRAGRYMLQLSMSTPQSVRATVTRSPGA